MNVKYKNIIRIMIKNEKNLWEKTWKYFRTRINTHTNVKNTFNSGMSFYKSKLELILGCLYNSQNHLFVLRDMEHEHDIDNVITFKETWI